MRLGRNGSPSSKAATAQRQCRRNCFSCGCRRCADLDTTEVCRRRCAPVDFQWTHAVSARSLVHVGAVAVQWRLVKRSDTKADCVELAAFHIRRAFRRRTRTLAELHYFQHGSGTCDPIHLKGDVVEKKRRNVCGCQRMHGVARVPTSMWNEETQRLSFFSRQIWPQLRLAASLTGVRGSHLYGAMHHTICRCQPTTSRIRSFISARQKAKTTGRSLDSWMRLEIWRCC